MIGKVTKPVRVATRAANATSRSSKVLNKTNKVVDTVGELIPVVNKVAKGTQDITSTLITNPIARDIRAMLTTKGIKTKDQLYKYVDNISEDELYNMYPQTNYLQVMRGNAQSKKDYTNFLKKLLVGTAFAAPAVTSVNQKE